MNSSEDNDPFEKGLEDLFDEIDSNHGQGEVSSQPISELINIDLERYQSPKFIAEGGMKCIWKVFDSKLGREVAMATPKEDIFFDPFVREAKIAALMSHPHVIKVFDVDLDHKGRPFFTMDLKNGKALDEYIKCLAKSRHENSNLKLFESLEIFMKICDAMSHAHSLGILHLDLKPSNIIVGEHGDVVICDWGLGMLVRSPDRLEVHSRDMKASQLHEDLLVTLSLPDDIKGTPGFMSPEQMEGRRSLSPASDIYSLGAILYFLLTHQSTQPLDLPLDEIMERIKSSKVVPPDSINPNQDLPSSICAVCMKALSVSPTDRYDSVESIRSDVHNFMAGYSTTAERTNFVKELILFYRRNQAVCLVIVISMMIILVGSGLFMNQIHDKRLDAENAKAVAIAEADKANKTLEMLISEKDWSTSLIEDGFDQMFDYLTDLTTVDVYYKDPEVSTEQALNTLTRMVQTKNDPKWLESRIGYLYFIQQKFDRAKSYLVHERYKNYKQLSEHYQALLNSDGLLSPQDFGQLFQKLDLQASRGEHTALLMVQHDSIRRNSRQDHSEVVKHLLKRHNPNWEMEIFSYDPNQQHLHLGGHGLTLLRSHHKGNKISMLRTLKLKSLKLSKVGIQHFAHLKDLKLETLDISETDIKPLKPFESYLSYIKTLRVSKLQAEELGQLNIGHIELIIAQ